MNRTTKLISSFTGSEYDYSLLFASLQQPSTNLQLICRSKPSLLKSSINLNESYTVSQFLSYYNKNSLYTEEYNKIDTIFKRDKYVKYSKLIINNIFTTLPNLVVDTKTLSKKDLFKLKNYILDLN